MAEILIQYSSSTAFASGVIRRLTHSPFSHVDFILTEEMVAFHNGNPQVVSGLLGVSGPGEYSSWHDAGGVLIRPVNPWPYNAPPKIARLQCSEAVRNLAIDYALSQLGKPFDNGALWRFLDDQGQHKYERRDWRDPETWFCSELVVRACEVGGLFPYPLAVMKDRVSPGDSLLIFNPFMTEENVREFLV